MEQAARVLDRVSPSWVLLGLVILPLLVMGCDGGEGNAQQASDTATKQVEASETAVLPGQSQERTDVEGVAAADPAGTPVATVNPQSDIVRADTEKAVGQEQHASGSRENPKVEIPELPPVDKRKTPPPITVTDMTGREISLAGLRGKVVLLVFWATWCRPCLMEIPHLIDLHEAYSKAGLEIVAISIDKRGLADVKPFLERRRAEGKPEIKYPIVPNGIPASYAFGGIASIPTSLLIDREGLVTQSFVGLWPGHVVEGYVKAVLQE